MSQAKATRCGPCNKPVKDNDSTAIGCEKCSAWFHGQCVGLSPDDSYNGQNSRMHLAVLWLP